MHVLIIGAGLAGLTIAQCLRKQGISFEIFDRDACDDSRFQGYALTLHTIVDQFTTNFPDDMPDLEASASHLVPLKLPSQLNVHYKSTKNRFGTQDEPDNRFIRCERLRLRRWLLLHLKVQWSKHATQFEYDDDGVSVHFEDGSSAKGDFLIGADGANSKVRECLMGRPNSEMLKTIPICTVIGELELSGDAFRHQLGLAHSAYNAVSTNPRFVTLNGLHYVHPDGRSGRFYWNFMEEDETVDDPNHWMRTATPKQKHDYVMERVRAGLPSRLREAFELTPVDGIKERFHLFRDVKLENVPAERAILVGDAAHVMTPFRGLGGFNAFVDAFAISKHLIELHDQNKDGDIAAIRATIDGYNAEMLQRGHEAVQISRDGQKHAIDTAWFMSTMLRWVPSFVKVFLNFLDSKNRLKAIPRTKVTLPDEVVA